MNREILFKGFYEDISNGDTTIIVNDKEYKGKWIYGNYEYEDFTKSHYITERLVNAHKLIKVIPETVSEYTGLEDKDGNKIFENDIIRLDEDYRKLISSADATTEEELCRKDCLVGYMDCAFMFGRNKLKADLFDSYLWVTNKHCQVIGTKFDKESMNE